MLPKPDSALVIIGHGSTLNPDSSQPTYEHADTIRRRRMFAEVVCAFWKEEPSMREVLRMVDSPVVYIVPNFISEGYFTQEVIPRELQLTGRTMPFPRLTAHYCDPVGLHPSMTKLLLRRAAEVAPGVPRQESSLVIVGHGTGLNENSTKSIKDQVALIRSMDCGFAEVVDAYMEEEPLVANWVALTTAPNVIVVPFFIADGLHSFQDIPVLLGIETEPAAAASRMDIFRRNPYHLHGRQLYFSSAIGTEPALADVILDQVEAFDAQPVVRPSRPASESGRDGLTTAHSGSNSECDSIPSRLKTWLDAGGRRLGEMVIRPQNDGSFLIRHHADAAAENLTRHTTTEAAREIAKYDAAGEFRPLKSAPTLVRGWELALPDVPSLLLALDFLYPAAVANWLRWLDGEATAEPLRTVLARQTGIYRITALLRDDEARQVVTDICGKNCLRHVMWPLDTAAPWPNLPPEKQSASASGPHAGGELPLLCLSACPLLVGAARSAVRRRMKSEKEAAERAS